MEEESAPTITLGLAEFHVLVVLAGVGYAQSQGKMSQIQAVQAILTHQIPPSTCADVVNRSMDALPQFFPPMPATVE